MNKEEIYDDQISPLMQNIIGICREHGIAMIASFNIAHDGEGPNGEDCSRLTCTSHLPALSMIASVRPPWRFRKAHHTTSA